MPTPSLTQIASVTGTIAGDLTVDASGDIFGASSEVFEVASGATGPNSLGTFDYNTTGGGPAGGVIEDSAGDLFGTSSYGGSSGNGALYEVVAGADTLTPLASPSGGLPQGPPVVDAAGDLFFAVGGTEIDELAAGSTKLSTLVTIKANGNLTIDSAGDIFGTTGGGALGYGSVFEIVAATKTVTTLVDFDGTNGDEPFGGLVLDAAGNLFGNAHNLFEISANAHVYTELATFSDGGKSEVNQITVEDGKIFGTTTTGSGSLYELAAGSQTVTTLLADADGVGGLATGADGNIYGAAGGDIYEFAACYCHGTRILTERGEVPIETLVIGDKVATMHRGARPIKWIGRRSYDGRFIAGQTLILPVCIKQGAIEDNVPARDLWVSPAHAIHLDGVLAPAFLLVNGVTIIQAASVDSVSYIHVELPEHDVIFAERCPAESFLDDNSRAQFHNAAEYRELYPDEEPHPHCRCLPRIESGFHLQSLQRRLAARAGVVISSKQDGPLRGFVDLAGPAVVAGWAQSETNPETPVCLDILVDGKRVMLALANRYRADLQKAGLGSGKHSFEVELPVGVFGRVEVRRSADQSCLSVTTAAAQAAA